MASVLHGPEGAVDARDVGLLPVEERHLCHALGDAVAVEVLARQDGEDRGLDQLVEGDAHARAVSEIGYLTFSGIRHTLILLGSIIVGDVQAAVIYEECCYEEDLFVGVRAPRRGIAVAKPLPKELCEPFPVIAVAIEAQRPHPAAAAFIQALREPRAQDILHRRGEWSCPICEMEQ